MRVYLPRPSKMPWNLPPWGSSWSSRWLRCMSSGLLGPPPGAWSWWHQQGWPGKPPVHLRRRFTTDIMKRFHYAQTVSHSDIPAAASRRVWNGYSRIVWYDNSTVHTARALWDSVQTGRGHQNAFPGAENVTHPSIKTQRAAVRRPWALQMFLTCYSSSSEQLQRPQPSLLICQFLLGVGINREVDGGEGDVAQEARFGSLTEKKQKTKNDQFKYVYILTTVSHGQRRWLRRFVLGIKWSGSCLIQPTGGFSCWWWSQRAPGRAAALGLQREIHHTHTALPWTPVYRLLLPRGSQLFFFLTSHTLSATH